jgi:Mrp family chromosome partitioning ATPase
MSSAKLRSFVEEAKQEYDLVILDGPPVLATAGARFLAIIADHVVFATLWSKTRRDLVCAAYNELTSANPSICGLALMNADMSRLRRAGYVGPGTYYGHYRDYHRPPSSPTG